MLSQKFSLIAFLIMLSAGIPVVGQAQSAPSAQPSASLVHQLFVTERKAHVGERLPAGIEVFNDKGVKIDLRTVIHGPAILFRIYPDCPPCDEILAMLRNPNTLAIAKGIPIVVLSTQDDKNQALHLPASVTVLHSPDKFRDKGFLDGRVTPTAFYFDDTLKLVQRKPGVTYPIQTLLRFPAQP